MEKKYNHEQLKPEENRISEPAIEYGIESEAEIEILPVLTEEELNELITGEEFLEQVLSHIDKLFDKK